MKCSNCGKEIPLTSQACPFCFTAIERKKEELAVEESTEDGELTTVTSSYNNSANNELNFGDMDNTSFDDSSLETNVHMDKKKKRQILLPIIIVLSSFVVLFVVLSMFTTPKKDYYKYYTGVIDTVYDYIDTNFTSSNAKNSGKYKFTYSIDGEGREFKGEYQYDLSKKFVDITGDLKNAAEEQGAIIVNDKTLTFELYAKNNELYIMSNNIYKLPILLPYEDETGLLTTKQYNLSSLVEGIKDATCIALKNMDYDMEKSVSVDVRGNTKKYNKLTLTMNYQNKKKFYVYFYNSLINNTDFVTEYGRILGKKSDEVERILSNYKTTMEYKYNQDDGETLVFNLYYKGKKVYRVEGISNKTNEKIVVDIDTDKLYFEYYKNGTVDTSISIKRIDSTMNDILTRLYMVNIKNDKDITFNLELEKNDSVKLKNKEIDEYKNIRDFTVEELNQLKGNLSIYGVKDDFVDRIADLFKTKCTKDLQCVCNDDETCSCTHETGIITCPKSVVRPEEENNEE